MVVKLSFFALSKRLPRWVKLNASFSSLSRANIVEFNPESDGNRLNLNEFESKVEFLMNKLHPDSLVHVLDSTNDLNSSLKLFKWASLQKNFKHNADTYYRMILKLGMNGNIEEMVGYCKEMLKESVPHPDEILSSLIDSFVKNHRFDEAMRVLSCLCSSSFRPSLIVFNELMGALVKAKKDFKDVLFVYKEMVKAGIIPNVETLNCFLEALFEANRIDMALDQYRKMNKKGCSPNSRTFEVLISGLITRQLVNESLVILNELFESGCDLDFSFYSCIIPELCSVDEFEAGMRLITMMRASKISPDSRTYGAMIDILSQKLYMDDAVSLYREMLDSGLTLSENVHIDIITGFCRSYNLGEAKKFLEDYDVDAVSSYNVLLEAYCNSGDLVAVANLFNNMLKNNRTDNLSWNILIECLCGNGWIRKAMEVLCKMIVCSFVPDSTTYSALIISKCKLNKLEEALLLFHLVEENCLALDFLSYSKLVESLCESEKALEAARIFSYMSSKNFPLHSTSFDMLIKGVCEAGKVSKAIEFLCLAPACGTFCTCVTYNIVLKNLSKCKNTDSLLLIMVSKMVVNCCSPNDETYCILIQSMSMSNQSKLCIWLLNLILNQGMFPNSETIKSLLICLIKDSKLHKILDAMDKHILSLDILDSSMYNMLISGLWKEGYTTSARHILDVMLVRGFVPDTVTHRMVMDSVAVETCEIGIEESFSKQDEVISILEDAFS